MLPQTKVRSASKENLLPILLVDDSRVVLTLHSLILKNAGFQCDIAESGSEALEKAMLTQYKMILTDLNMPKMDGYELIKKLREIQSYQETPIIMISTEQEVFDISRGLEVGANLYVVKPVKPDELITNVKLLLGEV